MLFQIIDSFYLLSIVKIKPIINRKLLEMAKIQIGNMYYDMYTLSIPYIIVESQRNLGLSLGLSCSRVLSINCKFFSLKIKCN